MAVAKRTPEIICGRYVGDSTGWEEVGDGNWIVLDLDPAPGIPRGNVLFDFTEGTIKGYDDEGNVTQTLDLIEVLSKLPKHEGE